jgi:hypothetical protein
MAYVLPGVVLAAPDPPAPGADPLFVALLQAVATNMTPAAAIATRLTNRINGPPSGLNT